MAMFVLINLADSMQTIEKNKFTIVDLLGDIGGLLDLLIRIIGLILSPYNSTLYLFHSINYLFKPQKKDS